MTLSEKLKYATQHVHREIEHAYYFKRLLSNDLRVEEYENILCLWKTFLTPIEENWMQNTELTNCFSDIEKRLKISRLNKDLDWLIRTYALNQNQLQTDISLEALVDDHQSLNLISTLYVIEGSTMSAMQIVKHLARFSFCTDESTHFYSHYGLHNRSMWQECKQEIDVWGQKNNELHERVCDKAIQCFLALSNFFNCPPLC